MFKINDASQISFYISLDSKRFTLKVDFNVQPFFFVNYRIFFSFFFSFYIWENSLNYVANPFISGLNISPTDHLNLHPDRQPCPVCSKSRKYFCYTCYVPVQCLKEYVPYIKLPIKVIFKIKHGCIPQLVFLPSSLPFFGKSFFP